MSVIIKLWSKSQISFIQNVGALLIDDFPIFKWLYWISVCFRLSQSSDIMFL